MGDVYDAAVSGDRLKSRVALRDRLAEEIETASARDLAALSKQFTDVLEQIAQHAEGDGTSKAEEIAKRREERRAAVDDESN